MAKIIDKWWWLVSAFLLVVVLIYGYKEMYFHQDDLDWFIMANRPIWAVMAAPIGDHVDYIFRLLLKVEWDTFHLYFPGYFTVSVLMHALVVWLIYLLARETSGRRDLAAIAAIIFTINTNWSETVLWISGQTISITALFVLFAMLSIWKKKYEIVTLFLASMTSALALGLLGATIIVFKKLRWKTLGLILLIALIYKWKGTDGTAIEASWKWVINVPIVWGLMMINSVIGRLVIPFDRFESFRIFIISLLTFSGFYCWRSKLLSIWRDSWSRFIILQISIYYLIVALGRTQYGIGIMRAERYAYLGLALFLLLFVRILRNWRIGRWVWIVPILVIIQSGGFYIKARAYVQRPQQLRTLVSDVKKMNPGEIDENAYLPHFVLNDERLRYKDLMNLMND